MALAKQCDICGTFFSDKLVGSLNREIRVHNVEGERSYSKLFFGKHEYDICRECYHSIEAVINGRRRTND